MSGGLVGGERRRREGRGGWEEAGGEFYQESYPGGGEGLDFDPFPRDPHYFATLLPSKQNRGATTKRVKEGTKRRRNSTRYNYNSIGQSNTVQAADIHVSMMPDLSENLANEETTWEEIMLIKAMPVPMAQKKEMKAKLLSAEAFRLQGFKRLDWRRRKAWAGFKVKLGEMWRGFCRRGWREGVRRARGDGVTRLLVNLPTSLIGFNLFIVTLISLALILPQAFLAPPSLSLVSFCLNGGRGNQSNNCCIEIGSDWENRSMDVWEILEGGGDGLLLWFGDYKGGGWEGEESGMRYDFTLAYASSIIIVFVIGGIWLIWRIGSAVRESVCKREGGKMGFCLTLFSGWDWGIGSDEGARGLKGALRLDLRERLEGIAEKEGNSGWKRRNGGSKGVAKTLGARIGVNAVAAAVIATGATFVYFVTGYCSGEYLEVEAGPMRALFGYGPFLVIASLNSLLPWSLGALSSLEGWPGESGEWARVGREAIARLSLLISFAFASFPFSSSLLLPSCCWETWLGRSLVKLILCEALARAVVLFFLRLPHALLASRFPSLPRPPLHPLSMGLRVCYLQSLTWIAVYFSPPVPLLTSFFLLSLTPLEALASLTSSSPPPLLIRPSSPSSTILLSFAFLTSFASLSFVFSSVQPSDSCGPFRISPSPLSYFLSSLPFYISPSSSPLLSPEVLFPVLLIFLIGLIYFRMVAIANRHLVTALRKQLVLEGHDKQFLLDRLSAFIKQHQERHKAAAAAARSIRPTTTAST